MRWNWKDAVVPLAVLAAAPWLAALLFTAFVGVRHYTPGYAEFATMWRTYAPSPHYRLLLLASAGLPILLAVAFAVIPWFDRRPKLFGDAHFASEREIQAAGLRAKQGIILGRLRGRLLRASGQLGILVVAPPRSGKGVGFVIPNLLTWTGSAVVNDLKLENYALTSGARVAMGQQVVLFAPLDPNGHTHGYNPLDFVSRDVRWRVDGVQSITSKLVVAHGKSDPMWSLEARALLDGLILFLLDAMEHATLGAVYRCVLSTPDFPAYLEWAKKEYGEHLDPFAVMQFNGFLGKAPKEQSGVLSTLKAALSIFGNPLIDRATSVTDFDPRRLRQVPMTIYLGVLPRDIARVSPLLNIFVQQVFDGLLHRIPTKGEPLQVLALLDEFTALGRLQNVEKGIAYFAGYNIVLAPVIQDLSQLEEIYGPAVAETFLSTANIRIAFAQNSLKTAKHLSESLGYRTIATRSRSRGGRDVWHTHTSESQARRELMLPHEIRELDRCKALVIVEAHPAVLADKIFYYRERRFRRLLAPSAPRPVLTSQVAEPPKQPDFVDAMTDEEIDDVAAAVGDENAEEPDHDRSSPGQ